MAKIVVTSVGYLGDVAPFVEPARRLARRGHEVLFVAPASYRALLAHEPFGFVDYPLDLSAPAMHADPYHERLLRHPILNSPRLAHYYINGYFLADPDRVISTLTDVLTGADAVLTHITPGPVVVPIAKHLGVPSVVGHAAPMIIPTAQRWTTFIPGPGSLGRRVNRASWRYSDWMLHALYGGPTLNKLRVNCGLPKMFDPAVHSFRDADRTVIIVPEAYAGPGFNDWPPVQWGGFSAWYPSTDAKLPATVEDFLANGDPPVVITLGSSAATGAAAKFAAIAAQVAALGRRSLIVTGTEQLQRATQTAIGHQPHALCVGFAPLGPVIAQGSAAVISGSLGTVGIALHAGIPTVVAPSLFDQVWHGHRIQELGLGRIASNTRTLRRALRDVITDPEGTYTKNTAELADQLRGTDGAQALTNTIIELLKSAPNPGGDVTGAA